jgi:DNA polymerase III delta subunit
MLYLLLGPDDYSKKQYITELATALKATVARYGEGETVPSLGELTEPSLFSQSKIFVIDSGISKLDLAENVDRIITGVHHVVCVETKLDKRKAASQALIKDKRITVKEFPIPQGNDLVAWIKNEVTTLGAKIDPTAIETLLEIWGASAAPRKGSFIPVEPQYSLWQVHQELTKLATYAAGDMITQEMVEALVPQSHETEVWDIINAIAEKDKKAVWDELAKFFYQSDGSDEKGKIIQLNALLADQFRSIAMVQDWGNRGVSETDILHQTGWKSGRLFVMKKIASRFTPKIVMAMLSRLESLDKELKSTSTPPRVLLDMITAQVLV